MKKLVLFLLLLLNSLTIFAQNSFFYELSVDRSKNEKATKLYIAYEVAGENYIDSLNLENNQIKINKALAQPVAANIYTNIAEIAPIIVMLANNSLVAEIDESSIAVSRSKLQDDFLLLNENDRIRPKYFPLYGELSAKNDTIGLQKLAVIFEALKKEDIKKSMDYFKANQSSLLSLYAFSRFATYFGDYSKIEDDFSLLPNWAKNSPDGKNILAKIEGSKSAQVDTKAKDFLQQSAGGQKISLANFEGKYILLDFWASWCSPCRKEHPKLVKIYEQFKDKNFEIISISLDAEQSKWLDAIKKDKLTWTQISDLKGQQNEIALMYGVQSVPANFLINAQGVIIGKNLKVEELNTILATQLN